MYSTTRVHYFNFGLRRSPANTAFTILLTLLFLIFLFLFMTLMAPSAQAQNSATPMWDQKVPATATGAAAMPQFAARLAHRQVSQANASRVVHPEKLRMSHRSNSPACSQTPVQPRLLPDDNVLYSNGPINGTVDAWTINFGYTVTDSILASGGVSGATFAFWLFPGDTVTSVDWALGTTPFSSDIAHGTASGANVTDTFISTNQYGFDIDAVTISGLSGSVGNGNWLANAVVPSGDLVYWDENSGPSAAEENALGTIPSESFNVLGNCPPSGCPPPPPPCFHADSKMQIIHDFASDQSGPYGVTIDHAGNLYGSTSGGDYGAGLVYRLAPRGQDWLYTPLYNFAGGANGSNPSQFVGPEGALYGIATGGIQNCGQDGTSYCGLIFRLRPSPVACNTAFCGWGKDVVYQFAGGEDGGYPGLAGFDQAGNLYGILALPNNVRGIFELTPSAGGWTKPVIYVFLGGVDGTGADSLLLGPDGNLYGLTPDGGDLSCGYGGSGCGTAFQLVPSGSGWTKTIIYTFESAENPRQLHADGAGNLYGVQTQEIVDSGWCPAFVTHADFVFGLSRANGEWVYQVLWGHFELDVDTHINNLTTDLSGHFYDTNEATKYAIWFDNGLHWIPYWYYGEVFGSDGSGWFSGYPPYNVLFEPNGIAVDSKHIYGTTSWCGQYSSGTIWSIPH